MGVQIAKVIFPVIFVVLIIVVMHVHAIAHVGTATSAIMNVATNMSHLKHVTGICNVLIAADPGENTSCFSSRLRSLSTPWLGESYAA